MRTTIDLSDELFREVKTRSVQEGITLKNLMTQFILSGMAVREAVSSPVARRIPPPVAIRRIPGQNQCPALSNRELHAIIDAEDIAVPRSASSTGGHKA